MQLAVIFSLSYFSFCLFLRKLTAFCTTLPSSLLANSLFFTSNYPHLTPKNLLFNDHFALLGHVFSGLKRSYLYQNGGYLCFSPRFLHHFSLRLAPKRIAFSTKTHCI